MNTVSKMMIISSLAILVMIISSGSYSIIQVKAVSNAIKEAQIGGTECEDLYAKLTNGYGNLTAMQTKEQTRSSAATQVAAHSPSQQETPAPAR